MTEANRDLEKTFDSIQGRIMIEREGERGGGKEKKEKMEKRNS